MKFDADRSQFDAGVWEDFDGARFLIAHISNTRFQRALARHQQPHRRKLEQGTLDPQINKEILCKAMSEGLILDWKNVESVAGDKDVPYTHEAAFKALMGDVEFRDFVSDFATNIANFRYEEIESVGKS